MGIPVSMLHDPRPVKAICWGESDSQSVWEVGQFYNTTEKITKLVIYREWERNTVLWVAVYVGDKVVARADCTGSTITYE